MPLAFFLVLTTWVFASRAWSHAPFASDLDVQRWLLYAAALVFGVMTGRSPSSAMWSARFVAVSLSTLVIAALVARLQPTLLSPSSLIAGEGRLSWPITYWNALGTVAGLAAVSAFHLASAREASLLDRILGSALLPVASAALVMTFSRGAIAATVVAFAIYVVVARPRGQLTTLIVGIPAIAWTVTTVVSSERLTSPGWQGASSEATHVTWIILAAAGAAVVLRLALWPLDRRIQSFTFPRLSRPLRLGIVAAIAVAVGGTAVAADAPEKLRAQVDAFNSPINVSDSGAGRLTSVQNNGRLKMWRAALTFYETDPLKGTGANTYRWNWNQIRNPAPERSEAHSLYLEVLSELGIVGLSLLAATLVALVLALGLSLRGPMRGPAGLGLTLLVLILFQAAFDWTWELPVATVAVLALVGTAISRPTMAGAEPETLGKRLGSDAEQTASVPTVEADPDSADREKPQTVELIAAGEAAATSERKRALAALFVVLLCVLPVRVTLSEGLRARAQKDLSEGRCGAAIESARSADRILDSPDAKVTLGYCLASLRRSAEAERALTEGMANDPENWLFPYSIAVVRAASGQDPRPMLRRARALDSAGKITAIGIETLVGTTPDEWQREAVRVPFPTRPN